LSYTSRPKFDIYRSPVIELGRRRMCKDTIEKGEKGRQRERERERERE